MLAVIKTGGKQYKVSPKDKIKVEKLDVEEGKEVIFGSVAGGGRYDKLIARFGKEDVPATGISIGVDRLVYAIEQFDKISANKKPLIIIANLISDANPLD